MSYTIRLGLFASAFITVLFLYSFLPNLSKPLDKNEHGDVMSTTFYLSQYVHTAKTGTWGNLLDLPWMYGYKHPLLYTEGFFMHGFLAIIITFFTQNIFLTFNLLSISAFFLSVFCMYLYLVSMTKRPWASIIGSVIFVANPYVLSRFPDHLLLTNLYFLPIFFLLVEKILEAGEKGEGNKLSLYGFLLGIALCISIFGMSIYYTIYIPLVLPLYILLRTHFSVRRLFFFLSSGTVIGILLYVAGLFSFYQLYQGVKTELSTDRAAFLYTSNYSMWLTDWISPPPSSLLFKDMKSHLYDSFPLLIGRLGNSTEHHIMLGITASMLSIVGIVLLVNIYMQRKMNRKKILEKEKHSELTQWATVWAGIGIVSFFLAFGVVITIMYGVSIPGPYILFYKLYPLAKYLRVSTRWAVFVFFSLGVLSTYALIILRTGLTNKQYYVLLTILFTCIVLEYSQKPYRFMTISPEVHTFFSAVSKDSSVKVILHWPMANKLPENFAGSRSEEFDSHYMFYQILFPGKQILNGYSGFQPESYWRRAGILNRFFPSQEAIDLLRRNGVDAVILHREEYKVPMQYDEEKQELASLNIPIKYESTNFVLFDIRRK
jgi:hypothetical protein